MAGRNLTAIINDLDSLRGAVGELLWLLSQQDGVTADEFPRAGAGGCLPEVVLQRFDQLLVEIQELGSCD